MNKINPNLVLIALLAVGGYFGLNKILEAFGVKDSAEEEAARKEGNKALKEQESKYNIWSGIASLKIAVGSKKTIKLLTERDADILAKRIYNAFGAFNDDEAAIFAVFREIRYQTQVASLVDAYRKLYKVDLLNTLKIKLSTAELSEVIYIITTIPTGIENAK